MPDLRKIDALSARIRDLISKTKQNDFAESLELKAALASHICVLLSGLIETTIRTVCGEHCSEKCEVRVANYVNSQLGLFRNPKWQSILQLLAQFDPDWRKSIEQRCTDEIKLAVDSVVNNRNQIAHGNQVQLTPHMVDEYAKSVFQFVAVVRIVVFG
jgi:hypothetical protein